MTKNSLNISQGTVYKDLEVEKATISCINLVVEFLILLKIG